MAVHGKNAFRRWLVAAFIAAVVSLTFSGKAWAGGAEDFCPSWKAGQWWTVEVMVEDRWEEVSGIPLSAGEKKPPPEIPGYPPKNPRDKKRMKKGFTFRFSVQGIERIERRRRVQPRGGDGFAPPAKPGEKPTPGMGKDPKNDPKVEEKKTSMECYKVELTRVESQRPFRAMLYYTTEELRLVCIEQLEGEGGKLERRRWQEGEIAFDPMESTGFGIPLSWPDFVLSEGAEVKVPERGKVRQTTRKEKDGTVIRLASIKDSGDERTAIEQLWKLDLPWWSWCKEGEMEARLLKHGKK